MPQFVKVLHKDGERFQYLCQKYSHLSKAKLNEGVLVGPVICKMRFNSNFKARMTPKDKEAWIPIKQVVT